MARKKNRMSVNTRRLLVFASLITAACSSHDDSNGPDPTIASQSQALDTDSDGIADCLNPTQDHSNPACSPVDNCPVNANNDQANVDLDGDGNACDVDLDGDGINNCADGNLYRCNDTNGTGRLVPSTDLDNCMFVANAAQTNSDGDNLGDACDQDSDQDGIDDLEDNCPTLPNADQLDSDVPQDGQGDVCDNDRDNDGVCNPGFPQVGCVGTDNCPDDANAYLTCVPGVTGNALCASYNAGTCQADNRCATQNDNDLDGAGDVCDTDDDNDGVPDTSDVCPNVADPAQLDNDRDGVGDACTEDTDGDGVLDGADNCKFFPNPTQVDTNHDGVGDACTGDLDADGILDQEDNCPTTPNNNQADQDLDDVGDLCDDDIDGDGVLNAVDNCPTTFNPSQSNMDGDSMGDACDSDRDGDTVPNASDNCPDISNVGQADADGDMIGDVCDDDEDGDGWCDTGVVSSPQCVGTDNCPTVANAGQQNMDGDALGDACDTDADGDGQTATAGDCCDTGQELSALRLCNTATASLINATATESCDNQDNDCDGTVDDGVDDDRDSWADSSSGLACPSPGGAGDCNDTNPLVNPSRPELCNSIDDNCVGGVDEGCSSPSSESCNGLDDDGDTFVDEIFACVQGSAGACITSCVTSGTRTCSALCVWGACAPPAENCTNGVDDDCDGLADCFDSNCSLVCVGCTDTDGDGYFGQAGCGTAVDCNNGNALVNPSRPELCNGIDDNCTGGVDEGGVCGPGCTDSDGDGFFAQGGLCGTQDCADGNPNVYPGHAEICNGIDDNCVGGVDEGLVCSPSMTTAHVHYVAPVGYAGGNIYVGGWYNGSPPYSVLCVDTNASPTIFDCDMSVPNGLPFVEFQMHLSYIGAPNNEIFWGDEICGPYGSDCGGVQGTVTVTVGGVGRTVTLVNAPDYVDPSGNGCTCEAGERILHNGRFTP